MKEKAIENKNTTFALINIQICISLFVVGTCIMHHLDILSGIRFILFQLLGLYCLGGAIVCLLKISCDNSLCRIAYSYSAGVIAQILLYFVRQLLNHDTIYRYFEYLLIVLACCFLFSSKKNHKETIKFNEVLIVDCFLTIILLITFFSVSLYYSLPNETGGTSFYIDWPFWITNSISLDRGFPPENVRLAGEVLNYHYFSSIVISQISHVVSIDIVVFSFYFSFIISSVLLVLVSYSLFSSFGINSLLTCVGMWCVLLTGGTTVTQEWHLYFCPFGFDYGYVFLMLTSISMLNGLKKNEFTINRVFISSILLMMTTGCKGPAGVIALIIAFLITCFLLINGQKRAMCWGVIWLSCFLFVSGVFINAFSALEIFNTQQNVTINPLRFIGIKEAYYSKGYIIEIASWLRNIGAPDNKFTKGLAIWLYIYRFNKPAVGLLIIGISIYLVSRKSRTNIGPDRIQVVLLISSIIGILLMLVTIQNGGSEMYFAMYVIPLAVLYGLSMFQKLIKNKGQYKIFTYGVVLYLSIIICVGSVYSYYAFFCPMMREGWYRYSGAKENQYTLYLTNDEYDAYIWIRDHTEKDAIVAVDSFSDEKKGISRAQLGAMFTERRIWNDGSYCNDLRTSEERKKSVTSLFGGDASQISILKKADVQYIVQTSDINQIRLKGEGITDIYKNKSTIVYKIE